MCRPGNPRLTSLKGRTITRGQVRGPLVQAGTQGEVREFPAGPQEEAEKRTTCPTPPAGVGLRECEGAARGGRASERGGDNDGELHPHTHGRTRCFTVLTVRPGLGTLPPGRALMEQPPGLSPKQKKSSSNVGFSRLKGVCTRCPTWRMRCALRPSRICTRHARSTPVGSVSPQQIMFLSVQPRF